MAKDTSKQQPDEDRPPVPTKPDATPERVQTPSQSHINVTPERSDPKASPGKQKGEPHLDDEGALKQQAQREQSRAAQPDAPRAPLQPRQADGVHDAGPPDAPVADAGGPVPRVLHQNERRPPVEGVKRYKVRAVNYGLQPQRYVLARSRKEAEEHYMRSVGLEAVVGMLGDDAPKPFYSVRELPD